jgi:hypothetical protein
MKEVLFSLSVVYSTPQKYVFDLTLWMYNTSNTQHHLWALSWAIILLLLFSHLLLFVEAVYVSFLHKILYEILFTPILFKPTWPANSNMWSSHVYESLSFWLRIILHYAIKDKGHFSLHLWVVQWNQDSSKRIQRMLSRITQKAWTTRIATIQNIRIRI